MKGHNEKMYHAHNGRPICDHRRFHRRNAGQGRDGSQGKISMAGIQGQELGRLKKVVDKDIRCVYADRLSNMQNELADMQKWDMKSFEISDFDMFSDEKDVIVTTYKVKVDGTLDGKDASGTYNAGSVWKLENGQWLAIFHTNIKEETTAKPAG